MTKPVYQGAYSRRFSNYIAGKDISASGSDSKQGTGFHLSVTSGNPSMGEVFVNKLVSASPLSSESALQQDGRGIQYSGERCRVTARPFSGFRFVQFETDIDDIGNTTANPLDFTLTKDTRIVARFEKAGSNAGKVMTARISWDGGMGRVNGDGLVLDEASRAGKGVITAAPGNTVTLTASPLDGYRFVGWHGAPVDGNASANITFRMNANYTITAEFAPVGSPQVSGGSSGGNSGGSSSVTGTSSDTVGKVKAFVKKWWWALAIAAYVCYRERKGVGK